MKFNINWLSWPIIQPELTDKIIMTEDPLKVLREVRKILNTPEGEAIRVHAKNYKNIILKEYLSNLVGYIDDRNKDGVNVDIYYQLKTSLEDVTNNKA